MTGAPGQPVALVTGAGRGIGREIALALAREGCAVAAVARSLDQVEATAAAVARIGAPSMALALDVTDESGVTRSVTSIMARLGRVDVLVNNAGIAESAPFVKTDAAFWERHLRVNATGPYLLARAVLPAMLERGWGRVINIASMAGLVGAPYVSAYTASKHALVGLTRALAAEVAGKGVTVNAICPGFAATDIVWNGARNIVARTGKSFEEAVEAMARLNPGGRLIEPAEVAAVAVRLLGEATTNGDAIVLDGTTEEVGMARKIEFLNPPELMKPVGFAHAALTRGGRTLFLAGQVAKDGGGRVVGKGDLVAQFRQVCENLKTLVASAGGSLTDVVKLTIYVIDTAEFKRQGKPIGVVYREYFGKHYPAMTLVGVRDLYDASEGCMIEIDGFACLPE